MVDDPNSKCVAFCAQIYVQHGAAAVVEFLDAVKDESGALPSGLKGARMVFPASDNNAPDACLDPKFYEGLAALQEAGLHWEFCCNPTMAPNLAECCAKFPEMTFVIDHCAHNGNDGGDMDVWGPAMDKLGALPNCCKHSLKPAQID
jgi:predicted TIM-barrel fold metal-dependent hydrolase